jgi:hypothetical protein
MSGDKFDAIVGTGGFRMLAIGDAAQFGLSTGPTIRGMNLAIVSRLAAACAIIKSTNTAETPIPHAATRETSAYRTPKGTRISIASWRSLRIFSVYPKLAGDAMEFMFSVNGIPPKPMMNSLLEAVKKHVSYGQLAGDGSKAYRSFMTVKKLSTEKSLTLDKFSADEGNPHILVDKSICAKFSGRACPIACPALLSAEERRSQPLIRRIPRMRNLSRQVHRRGRYQSGTIPAHPAGLNFITASRRIHRRDRA